MPAGKLKGKGIRVQIQGGFSPQVIPRMNAIISKEKKDIKNEGFASIANPIKSNVIGTKGVVPQPSPKKPPEKPDKKKN